MRNLALILGGCALLAAALCLPPRRASANPVQQLGSLARGVSINQPLGGETLVLTTATPVTRNASSVGGELFNHGPNAIYCGFGKNVDGGAPIYVDGGAFIEDDGARPIAAGGSWSFQQPGWAPLWCVTSVAQLHHAATILSEAF